MGMTTRTNTSTGISTTGLEVLSGLISSLLEDKQMFTLITPTKSKKVFDLKAEISNGITSPSVVFQKDQKTNLIIDFKDSLYQFLEGAFI